MRHRRAPADAEGQTGLHYPPGEGQAKKGGKIGFSGRLEWARRRNALTEKLGARRALGQPVEDLTESNPTAAGFAYPEQAILNALADRRALQYEPSAAGLENARLAVAGYYRERGVLVTPQRILLTASTSEAYSYLFKLLADPGDEILVPRPSYPLFEFLASLELVKVRQYPLRYHEGWFLDLEALQAAITPRCRAVVVVHPNNPTGSFLKRDEHHRLVEVALESNLALISDEVFSDYALAPDPARQGSLAGETQVPVFALNGLSKSAGLPQMKLGWIVAAGPAAAVSRAMEGLEWIADTYLSVSAPVQHALGRLLEAGAAVRAEIQRRVLDNRSLLAAAVAGTPLSLLDSEGGWSAILQLPRTRGEDEWTLALLDQGVLVQPGYFYDFEDEAHLVLSLLTRPDVFREGVRRIVGCAG